LIALGFIGSDGGFYMTECGREKLKRVGTSLLTGRYRTAPPGWFPVGVSTSKMTDEQAERWLRDHPPRKAWCWSIPHEGMTTYGFEDAEDARAFRAASGAPAGSMSFTSKSKRSRPA